MSAHLKNPWVWFHGLLAALIGGGSSGVVAGLAAIGIAPDKFDMNSNLHNTMKMVGAVFVISAIISAFGYLKQSPLPQIVETDTQIITKP
jgi:hypothetical protein